MTTETTIRHEVEVDTRIADAFETYVVARRDVSLAEARLENAEKAVAKYGARFERDLPGAHEALAIAQAQASAAWAGYLRVAAEYEGWSRFYLVKASNGHIHSSMDCSTCFETTEYGWLVDVSGLTEAEAVAAHGERLCSVCFPTAPSAWTDGKAYYARIARETRDARNAEREAKAAAKAAKKAATFAANHYSIRTTRASDGYVSLHEGRMSLATAKREVKAWLGEYFPTVEVIDLDTMEVVG